MSKSASKYDAVQGSKKELNTMNSCVNMTDMSFVLGLCFDMK